MGFPWLGKKTWSVQVFYFEKVSSPGCSFDFVLQASIPNIASGRKKQECAKIPMRCQLTHEVELNPSVYNL